MAMGVSANAGDLAPPSGPAAPTMKTLDEIEPAAVINDTNTPGVPAARFRIASSGAYVLADDVFAGDGQNGIEIAASDVTIDLNGFTIFGAGLFSPNTLSGITTLGPERSNITIRNGVIRDFDLTGIALSDVADVTLDGVLCTGNAQRGAWLGDSAIVRACRFINNGVGGIELGEHAIVRDSVLRENLGNGLDADRGATIERCVAHANTGDGFVLSGAGVIRGCTAQNNGDDGFVSSFEGSAIIGCAARANGTTNPLGETGTGFINGPAGLLADCVSERNFDGGFSFSGAARDCVAEQDFEFGFRLIGGAVLTRARVDAGPGARAIDVPFDGAGVIECHVARGSIVVEGEGCRVEGNHVASGAIIVNDTENVIVRNSVSAISQATAYQVVPGNALGPVVTASGLASASAWANVYVFDAP